MKKIKAIITSGFGKGAIYVSKEPYYSFFCKVLGEKPFPGTLNVILIDSNGTRPNLKESFKPSKGGGIRYSRGYVKKGDKMFPCIILRPELSKHPESILEIVSPIYLRKALDLRDGEIVEIIFDEK